MSAHRLIILAGAVAALGLTSCQTVENRPLLMSPTQYQVSYEIDRVHDSAVEPFNRPLILQTDAERLLADFTNLVP